MYLIQLIQQKLINKNNYLVSKRSINHEKGVFSTILDYIFLEVQQNETENKNLADFLY